MKCPNCGDYAIGVKGPGVFYCMVCGATIPAKKKPAVKK